MTTTDTTTTGRVPASGDPVTIVWRGPSGIADLGLLASNVDGVLVEKAGVTIRLDLCTRSLAEEGKTWIRGHHTEESEEGRALLAAHALLDDVLPAQSGWWWCRS